MTMASKPELVEKISQAIRQSPEQMLPFVKFMEMALYEPKLGYYASSHQQLGPQGDFVTSPHLCSDFGELIAIQLREFWQVLGQPKTFTVVEMGAGQGFISLDALNFLLTDNPADPFLRALDWKIIEKSEGLIRWQKHYLAKRIEPLLNSLELSIDIQWTSLEALAKSPITGVFFSNELLDAFPVHLLEVQNSELSELAVQEDSIHGKEFSLTPMALSSSVAEYLSELPIDIQNLPERYRCEVNVASSDWMASVSQALKEGFVLTIDYGYSHQQLYSPARRDGTLQCYTQHKTHGDPLIRVGNQDITSHVNFTALEYFGAQNQLETLGITQQGLFLMALGLGDRLVANNTQSSLAQVNQVLQRREALHALMNPMGLGGFKVLLQGKGLSSEQQNFEFQGFKGAFPDSLI